MSSAERKEHVGKLLALKRTTFDDHLAVEQSYKAGGLLEAGPATVQAEGDADQDEDDATDATIQVAAKVYANIFQHLFYRAIFDEGHKLKNAETRNFFAAYTVFAPKVWYVTATPMINRISDLLGYLNFWWKASWLEDLEVLDDYSLPASPETRYIDDTIQDIEQQCPNYMAKYRGQHLYLFDPKAFSKLYNKGSLDGGRTTSTVLKAVLTRVSLRWTMASKIPLDDTTFIQPGHSVPMYHISSVELEMSANEKAKYAQIWSMWQPVLYKSGRASTSKKRPSADARGLRNVTAHRHLCCSTLDSKFHEMMMVKQAQTMAAAVHTWVDDGGDFGFTQYFQATRPWPIPAYRDRLSLCSYFLMYNPKLRYACRHFYNAQYEIGPTPMSGKLCVYVHWPLNQWQIEAFLKNLGLKCYSLNASMTPKQRDEMVARFNDPNDDTRLMVANTRSAALGLNLQSGCHKILILDFPDNINLIIQVIGRVHRINQLFEQYIWIVALNETYDQWLWAQAIKKMIGQVTAESKLKPTAPKAEDLQLALEENDDLDTQQFYNLVVDQELAQQAEGFICQLLGIRCARSTWDTKDLSLPHRAGTVSAETPSARTRLTPQRLPGETRNGSDSGRVRKTDPLHVPSPFDIPDVLTTPQPATQPPLLPRARPAPLPVLRDTPSPETPPRTERRTKHGMDPVQGPLTASTQRRHNPLSVFSTNRTARTSCPCTVTPFSQSRVRSTTFATGCGSGSPLQWTSPGAPPGFVTSTAVARRLLPPTSQNDSAPSTTAASCQPPPQFRGRTSFAPSPAKFYCRTSTRKPQRVALTKAPAAPVTTTPTAQAATTVMTA